jgi:hypothetical protein
MTNLGITHQNQAIQFANSQLKSGFDQLLSDTLASTVSTPFKLIQNSNSVVQQAPQMMASMCGQRAPGGLGGQPSSIMPSSNFTPSYPTTPSWGSAGNGLTLNNASLFPR